MNPVIIGDCQQETRIYALCEFPSQIPRYIGKTVTPLMRRLKNHLSVARRNPRLPVGRWLAKRMRDGADICIKWIETVPPGEDWARRESYWISKYRDQGFQMLNLTDGGEGVAGLVFSQEHRRKIADALRAGRFFACETCGANFWRKPNEIKGGNCRFCSRPCYAKSLKGVYRPLSVACVENGIKAAAEKRKAQSTCKRGHALSGDNLFITSQGSRGCKECRKIHKATYRSKSHG